MFTLSSTNMWLQTSQNVRKISILTCCLLFDTTHQENKDFYPLKRLYLNEIPNLYETVCVRKPYKKSKWQLVVASICLDFQVLIVIKICNLILTVSVKWILQHLDLNHLRFYRNNGWMVCWAPSRLIDKLIMNAMQT